MKGVFLWWQGKMSVKISYPVKNLDIHNTMLFSAKFVYQKILFILPLAWAAVHISFTAKFSRTCTE